jgi:hypothetical protein
MIDPVRASSWPQLDHVENMPVGIICDKVGPDVDSFWIVLYIWYYKSVNKEGGTQSRTNHRIEFRIHDRRFTTQRRIAQFSKKHLEERM